MRVSAEAIAALGVGLHSLADELGAVATASADQSWAMGNGQSAPLLREVLTDFEHQRLALVRSLYRLGDLARHAGGAYAEVESTVVRWSGGGSW